MLFFLVIFFLFSSLNYIFNHLIFYTFLLLLKKFKDFLKFKELTKIEIKQIEAHTTQYWYFLSNIENNSLTRDVVGGGFIDIADDNLQDLYDDYYNIEIMTATQLFVNAIVIIPLYRRISKKKLADLQEVLETIPYDEEMEDYLYLHDILKNSEIFYDFDYI